MITALALAIVLAMVGRVGLAWYSIGSNDATTWLKFATGVDRRGLAEAYYRYPSLNHPPLPVLWSGMALRLAGSAGTSFYFIFKLPMILADAATCLVLALIWSRRRDAAHGWLAAAIYATSPVAILVSAYHCNTDSLYVFFSLLGVYHATRRQMLLAGLALAAAINVKLVPVLLILPLASLCQSRSELRRLVLGLLAGVPPFMPVLVESGRHFVRNALGYTPYSDRWGIPFFLYELHEQRPSLRLAHDLMYFYSANGRWLILAAVMLLSFFSWRWRRWNASQLAAMSMAIFLVMAPGFGVQYTVAVLPPLVAVTLGTGLLYSLLAGLFILLVYGLNWTGGVPLYSLFDSPYPMPGPLFGLLAWWVLLVFVIRLIQPVRPPTGSPPG
jgi:hypothetical protein